ncbi:MAG: AAA family ATPase [Proteobacteria bacterium]|nr:AAA family ATPase [Pseudomonadota bacterium]
MALYHFSAKVLSRSGRNTVRSLAYRAGCKLYDERTGETFNYQNKPVQHVELVLPKDAPEWTREIQELMKVDRQKGVQAFSNMVERAEKRVDAQVYREFEFALHRELTAEQNIALAREFVEDQICSHGMAAQLNFHFDVDPETGEEKPHCHVLAVTRRLEENGLSAKKEREWNDKSFLCDLRVKWEEYSNFHLKLNGHDIQIDHRSNKERGIEMEPQPKLGRNVLEQDKRLQQLEGSDGSPITDRGRIFHEAQLRNLYRVVRNPNEVLNIVTKHNATFMWADVQKVLHRYVDEAPLFQRIEAKLKNSNELLLLQSDEKLGDVYTTHTMLKAEKSLIETAEYLNQVKSHGVEADHIEHCIEKANKALEDKGGLSDDQVKAIHHLVDEGQIKCVVGIAGAGKTTALGVCHEIWKAEGYRVYGLAPTGKAAQNLESKNLEQSGIESTTLHKFLKSFGEGRCQYNENSVLVLDEAGMVDVERFGKLLGAVQQLGVKLIVVGDGAQLQPVEAGPAFRLVTERLGRLELNTVVRQKEEWQREATVLFGQQKTAEAIKAYADKGCVHIVEEKLSDSDSVKLYEVAHRVSSLMYREMAKEVNQENPESSSHYSLIRNHQDFERYAYWKGIERKAAQSIFENVEATRPILEERGIDPLNIALVLADKFQPKEVQQEEAKELLKGCQLDHLIGIQKAAGIRVDVREQTKEELIQSWHRGFQSELEKASIMMAYNNRDVNDLNRSARSLLKESGRLSKKEFTYTVKKEVEDDFGRKNILQEEKGFSQGDRIVFTRNNYGLGVKNGTMGTITELDNQKVQVSLDEGKDISFAPKLNPHFDQGWAVTIHKSQGTTVDRTFVLASYEMTQNLAYVAMTRHREDVKVFGSSLDFWREEKLPEVLSKSGEKLGPADYLDAESLNKLMQQEDNLLTKIFDRMSNELEAMGVVAKKTFWQIADHFLRIQREQEIRIIPQKIREETRAEELFKEKQNTHEKISPTLSSIYEEMKHPAYANATIVKRAFEKGLKVYGEAQAIAYWESKKEDYMNVYQQNLGKVEIELNSPVLKNFSEKWKAQAFEPAKDDPLKALNFLHQFKEKELVRQEKASAAAQAEAQKEHIAGLYRKYWNTQEMIKDHPSVHSHYHGYLEGLAKEIYLDKSFMKALKISDAKDARDIESFARGKEYQQKQEQEHIHSLDRGRGGISL